MAVYISALITFLLALLGVIMALNESWAQRHKLLIIGAFGIVGMGGVWSSIQVAMDADSASERLATSMISLNDKTVEIGRMQSLNTELQKQLVDSSKAITELAKEGIYSSTGGNSIAYLKVLFGKGPQPKVQLVALQKGEYPLSDLSVSILDNDNLSVTHLRQIGTLPVSGARDLGNIGFPLSQSDKRILATFSSRNGAWDQLILLRHDVKGWHFATRVQRNPGQIKFDKLHENRAVLFEQIDKGFPGEKITEEDWKQFNGLTVYCSDCR